MPDASRHVHATGPGRGVVGVVVGARSVGGGPILGSPERCAAQFRFGSLRPEQAYGMMIAPDA